jgi:hypothetical protein
VPPYHHAQQYHPAYIHVRSLPLPFLRGCR